MKALAVDNTQKLSVVEVDIPKYNDYQALVKTVSCGICNGTDLKLIHNNFKNFTTYPALLGHEGVGEVIELGSKVTSFKVGDKVLLPFLEEKTGEYYSGWGGYAQYGIVGDVKAMVDDGFGERFDGYSESYYAQTILPKDFDGVKSSMIVTFREVLSAIYRFGFAANEPVLIYGAGPVGLCFIKFCKLLGMSTVISAEIDDKKLEEAKKMGADYAFNTKQCSIVEEVKKLFPEGILNIVDAAGVNALINQAMEMVKYNGKICCYGISPKTSMELDWSKAPYNWSLLFVQWPSKKEEGEAHNQIISWIKSGAVSFDDFISEIIPFENIIEAFDKVQAGKTEKKLIISYN